MLNFWMIIKEGNVSVIIIYFWIIVIVSTSVSKLYRLNYNLKILNYGNFINYIVNYNISDSNYVRYIKLYGHIDIHYLIFTSLYAEIFFWRLVVLSLFTYTLFLHLLRFLGTGFSYLGLAIYNLRWCNFRVFTLRSLGEEYGLFSLFGLWG